MDVSAYAVASTGCYEATEELLATITHIPCQSFAASGLFVRPMVLLQTIELNPHTVEMAWQP